MVLYRNVLAEGTLTASTQAADGFAANALGPQTNDFWIPTALPAWLQVTLGAAVSCDCASIVAHNLWSKGCTVYVEYFSGGSWQVAASCTPTDNSTILLIFPSRSSNQWRIRTTGSSVPSIGIAMIGPRFLIPEGIQMDYVPIHLALDIELMPSITIAGQYQGTMINRKGASTSISFALQDKTWIETTAKPFIKHFNSGSPFMWASCPGVLEFDTAYCWRSGNVLSASYGAGAQFGSMKMEISAYVEP